jgi:hypothetical protein
MYSLLVELQITLSKDIFNGVRVRVMLFTATVNIKYARERTNKRKRNPRGPSRMENPETLSTLSTQDTGEINAREKRIVSCVLNVDSASGLPILDCPFVFL